MTFQLAFSWQVIFQCLWALLSALFNCSGPSLGPKTQYVFVKGSSWLVAMGCYTPLTCKNRLRMHDNLEIPECKILSNKEPFESEAPGTAATSTYTLLQAAMIVKLDIKMSNVLRLLNSFDGHTYNWVLSFVLKDVTLQYKILCCCTWMLLNVSCNVTFWLETAGVNALNASSLRKVATRPLVKERGGVAGTLGKR